MPDEVRQHILSQGEAAVQPLLALLEDRDLLCVDAPGGGYAPIHALALLAELRAGEAVVAALELLLELDPEDHAYDPVTRALQNFGAEVIGPALELRQRRSGERANEVLCRVLARAGTRDPRIWGLLLEQLNRTPELGASLLADYGDERAVYPLKATLCWIEPIDDGSPLSGADVVELCGAIVRLGGALTPAESRKLKRATRLPEQRPSQVAHLGA